MKYVIIGGDAAGMSAAMQIIRHDKNAQVITLEKGEIYSYGQCGLPYYISRDVESTSALIARSVDTFREKGIDARTSVEVKNVDTDNKVVIGIELESGHTFHLHYDKLLIASGANPMIPDWPGKDLENIYALKTIPDAELIHNRITPDLKKAVIIGGGYIGLEMAEAFKKRGLDVTIIDRGEHLAKIFDKEMAEHIHKEAEDQGIHVILNEDVKGFTGSHKVEQVETNHGIYPTDIVLVATGVAPNTGFTNDTIKKGIKGAIEVTSFMETNIEDVYAAGDCALQYHRTKKAYDYIPLGTHANKMGRIAGLNMVGQRSAFDGIVGTSIMKFMDLDLGRTGLTETEALELNFEVETAVIKATDKANYYPTAQPLWIKIIANKKDHRLLGGQIIGKAGVAKRTDVLATALFCNLTVRDLESLDLSYAPPFNGVWDPIQTAARRIK